MLRVMVAPTLQGILHDDSLTNDQRLVVSKIHQDIESAKVIQGRLFVWMTSGNAYRVDPNGSTWKLS